MAQTTSVLWSVDQGLGEKAKEQARQNIGAASEKLTEVVNNHTEKIETNTTKIGQITESVEGIESSLANKKDRQTELNFGGSATKTVKSITQDANGVINVEYENIVRSEITKENVTNALGYTPVDESKVGAANGVASLDSSGKIPASQIPGGFDNIEEYDTIKSFPTTGKEGKIYVTKDTNLTYRWTGSQYVEISPSLALGETATTAYRGDRGKVAYDHSQVSGNSTIHHTHANKELLDTYTQTEADLANAVAKVHEHGNKDVLDGITSSDVANWNSKQNKLTAGSGITISNSTISALNRLIPVDISTNETKDFNNLPSDNILYYKNSSTDFSNQPEKTSFRFIQWTSSYYYSVQLAISNTKNIYIRTSRKNSNNGGKVWDDWTQFANIDELNKVNSSLTTHTNDTTIHITADERKKWNAKQDALPFDNTPTKGSDNPVTSDGIKTAIDTVNAKGLTVKEISGEQVICFE